MEGKKTLNLETKIGNVQINEEEIIRFREGPLGFTDTQDFVLIEEDDDSIFLWLQSVNSRDIAFPILEVELIGYKSEKFIDASIREQLGIAQDSDVSVYSIISIPDKVEQMTANIKAPVVINSTKKTGVQYIMPNPELEIAKPVFKALREKLTASSNVAGPCDASSTIKRRKSCVSKEKRLNS
ncbi:MAG: flagellar assembly protein FliW [Oligoflexia bacterium]|nr:flagellar assembly protein FliW [Oligoflexia bacterium]